jgi:hypothetical protein
MKTTSFKLVFLLILSALTCNISFSQNAFDKSATLDSSSSVFDSSALDNIAEEVDLYAFEDTKPIDYYEIQEERSVATILARTMFAFGLGLGFGEEQTLWCLHAAYYMQLSMFANSALYGAIGVVYEGLSYNDLSQSLIDFQLKLLMFSPITKFKEVFLMYGVLMAYGIGSEKFNNFKTDLTRITASIIIGLNIILTTTISLALQTSIFTYQKTNYKPDSGNDYDNSFTRAFLNKQNLIALSLFINLKMGQARN